jgi:hypothetical protein
MTYSVADCSVAVGAGSCLSRDRLAPCWLVLAGHGVSLDAVVCHVT